MIFKFGIFFILIGLTIAAPFIGKHPTPSELAMIEKQAGGTLPNGPLPTSLQPGMILDFQVIAANELFEIAFFESLLNNITSNKPGYTDFGELNRDYVIKSLTQILAQEKLHAIGANAILKNVGAKTIGPCQYTFPVQDFKSTIELAATFTDLVLGSLQRVQQDLMKEGTGEKEEAEGLIGLIGSIIGQEGQQDGAYRLIQNKVPSSSPFLTASAGQFAFNALHQTFIIPGSCPPSSNMNQIQIPSFIPFSLAKSSIIPTSEKDTILTFESKGKETNTLQGNYLVYISGKNQPIVVPIKYVSRQGEECSFKADFPFVSKGFSKGLTIAVLVNKTRDFKMPAEVAEVTIAGPVLIEVE